MCYLSPTSRVNPSSEGPMNPGSDGFLLSPSPTCTLAHAVVPHQAVAIGCGKHVTPHHNLPKLCSRSGLVGKQGERELQDGYCSLLSLGMVVMDASISGWGAPQEDLGIIGLWSLEEQVPHINLLEQQALWLVLKVFLPSIQSRSVQILMVNSTAMWYVNKQDGSGYHLHCLQALRLDMDTLSRDLDHHQPISGVSKCQHRQATLSCQSCVAYSTGGCPGHLHQWDTPQVDFSASSKMHISSSVCSSFC